MVNGKLTNWYHWFAILHDVQITRWWKKSGNSRNKTIVDSELWKPQLDYGSSRAISRK